MDLNPNPAIRLHGDESNLLIANEFGAVQDAHDISKAKDIAEALNEHYPGHLWAVSVRGEQGVATIHNLLLSGEWGYTIHLDKHPTSSDLKATAIRGAGEILERFNVTRGRINQDKMGEMTVDRLGRVIGDLSK